MPYQLLSGEQKARGLAVNARPDLTFFDPIGRAVIRSIELFVSLSTLTSGLSLIAAVICVWTMQVTTRDFGTRSGEERMAFIQRIAIALIAFFLVINDITPCITPDPPWIANLPLVIAIGLFMLVFGITYRRKEKHRENRAITESEFYRSNVVAAERKRPRKTGAERKK